MSDDKNMELNNEQMEQATGGTGHAVAPSVAEDRMGGHAVAPSIGVDPMGREVAPLKPVTDAVASHR